MMNVFDTCYVTNEHARVPTSIYQGDPSRINLDEDSGCESQEDQVTPLLNRAKGGKKRACSYSPRVWSDAIVRYDYFPQPPTDKYYLVDS